MSLFEVVDLREAAGVDASFVEGVLTYAVPVRGAEAQGLRDELVFVIDVREPREWRRSHVPGSRCIPLDVLDLEHLPVDTLVLLVCETGFRSRRAAQLLTALGADDSSLFVLSGGLRAWGAAGYPLARGGRRRAR